MMALPLILTEAESRWDCFKSTRTILQVVCRLHPILCVAKEKEYLPHIFLLGIPYVPQLRIQWSSLTTYVQTTHSSVLKSEEKWIWSLSLFKIPCKASNSSVSRILLPPDFLKKHRVFLISRTVFSFCRMNIFDLLKISLSIPTVLFSASKVTQTSTVSQRLRCFLSALFSTSSCS